MRLTIPLLCFTAMVLVTAQTAPVPAWAADPTPRDIKCQWKKHRKAGRYQACVQDALVEKAKNPLFDLDAARAACVAAFKTAWELQDANAAALGEVCLDGAGNFDAVRAMLDGPADRLEAWLAGTRWVNNGDGTATDSKTGLQWELKTDDGTVHDKDDVYYYSSGDGTNGTAFTSFLPALNGGATGVGNCTESGGGFAGHCDWRLPTLAELQGIVDLSAPGCGRGAPCTTIPGFSVLDYHWSSSAYAADLQKAWLVYFGDGDTVAVDKVLHTHVRAVRGGS